MAMNIVYTFDDGYVDIAAVSILSLLENNKEVNNLHIIIVNCGISAANISFLTSLVNRYSRTVEFVNGKNMEKRIPIELELSYWSFVCYVRLFFSELLINYDKVMHIDCDTLVLGNLETVYNSDMYGNMCSACLDCVPSVKYAAGLQEKDYYFSNGFIIFDLKKMRENSIQDRFIDYIIEKNGKLPHLDQDVLNVVLKNKIQVLNPEYNMMTITLLYGEKSYQFFKDEPYYSQSQIQSALQSPKIVHLVGYRYSSKPWTQPCYHPYNSVWKKYYEKLGRDDKQIFKYKKKKYGFIRELICIIWNMGYSIKMIRNIQFLLEKQRIRKACK